MIRAERLALIWPNVLLTWLPFGSKTAPANVLSALGHNNASLVFEPQLPQERHPPTPFKGEIAPMQTWDASFKGGIAFFKPTVAALPSDTDR